MEILSKEIKRGKDGLLRVEVDLVSTSLWRSKLSYLDPSLV